MKYFLCFVLFLLAGVSLIADEPRMKDGAVLWGENCMGCHIPQNFLVAQPDEGHVEALIEEIEYNIYNPESGMGFLAPMKDNVLERIAEFLVYGSHGEGWMAGGHGWQAEEFGTDTCFKCHDNPRLYKEPPANCNSCHS